MHIDCPMDRTCNVALLHGRETTNQIVRYLLFNQCDHSSNCSTAPRASELMLHPICAGVRHGDVAMVLRIPTSFDKVWKYG